MELTSYCIEKPNSYVANVTKTFSFWVLGLVFGIYFYKQISSTSQDFILALFHGHYSFTSILSVGLLPAVISVAFLVFFPRPVFFACVFSFAFLRSFTGHAIISIFGSSSWLFWFALCFTSTVSLSVTWFTWLLVFKEKGNLAIYKKISFALLLIFLIQVFDFRFILPFFSSIFSL